VTRTDPRPLEWQRNNKNSVLAEEVPNHAFRLHVTSSLTVSTGEEKLIFSAIAESVTRTRLFAVQFLRGLVLSVAVSKYKSFLMQESDEIALGSLVFYILLSALPLTSV